MIPFFFLVKYMVWTFSNSIRPFRFRFRPFQIQTLPSLSNEVRSGLTQKGLWFKSVSLSHIYGISFGLFDLKGLLLVKVKLLHQLKGEPSRLAKGWINDATQLLEIRQACQLLTAYISSIYIGTRLKWGLLFWCWCSV